MAMEESAAAAAKFNTTESIATALTSEAALEEQVRAALSLAEHETASCEIAQSDAVHVSALASTLMTQLAESNAAHAAAVAKADSAEQRLRRATRHHREQILDEEERNQGAQLQIWMSYNNNLNEVKQGVPVKAVDQGTMPFTGKAFQLPEAACPPSKANAKHLPVPGQLTHRTRQLRVNHRHQSLQSMS